MQGISKVVGAFYVLVNAALTRLRRIVCAAVLRHTPVCLWQLSATGKHSAPLWLHRYVVHLLLIHGRGKENYYVSKLIAVTTFKRKKKISDNNNMTTSLDDLV